MLPLILNGVALAVIAGLTIMAALKIHEVRKAATWLTTNGKIVTSRIAAKAVVRQEMKEHHDHSGKNRASSEIRNVAEIVFSYTVAGKAYSANTINFISLTTTPAADVAKYPPGKDVTVYYDPARPERSVIDRDLPAGFQRSIATTIAVLITLLIAVNLAVGPTAPFITGLLPSQRYAGMAIFAGLMGLAVLIFAYALFAKNRAILRWPLVDASVVDPATRPDLSGGLVHGSDWTIYSYTVAGNLYYSDSSIPGAVHTGRIATAQSTGARPDKRRPGNARPDLDKSGPIRVHVDPTNPARSFARPGWGSVVIVASAGIALLALAVFLAFYAVPPGPR